VSLPVFLLGRIKTVSYTIAPSLLILAKVLIHQFAIVSLVSLLLDDLVLSVSLGRKWPTVRRSPITPKEGIGSLLLALLFSVIVFVITYAISPARAWSILLEAIPLVGVTAACMLLFLLIFWIIVQILLRKDGKLNEIERGDRAASVALSSRESRTRQYKIVWLVVIVVILMLPILGCGRGRNPLLTQAEAEQMAGVFCLPTYLPAEVDPTPVFYASGEPEIPDTTVLYKNTKTSERVFVVTMRNISQASLDLQGNSQRYDPYRSCEDRFVLSNGFNVCDISARSRKANFEADVLISGPVLVTFFSWLVNQDKNWTIYYIDSSLGLEETKKIAASMCLE
jgi:hypothetical protein